MTPVTFDTAAAVRWLRQPCPDLPEATRAECLGVDDELFGPGLEGFLPTIDNILAAEPAGLRYRADLTAVLLWRIPDGDALDQGALITVDLADGNRLSPPCTRTSKTSPSAASTASPPPCRPWPTPLARHACCWSATSAPTPTTRRTRRPRRCSDDARQSRQT